MAYALTAENLLLTGAATALSAVKKEVLTAKDTGRSQAKTDFASDA